ncbi:hypothetical protein C882_1248 [Caenispirillum salinarum AK4]|uniref:Uncharacterized protein n=1 Tax=Caenispirillum salinarum AK4 TaxID=1238182 RepID=K9HAS9_9PROT|nr:hypothetical protein C882_1248 [Caenispirillum salinarum AK4]
MEAGNLQGIPQGSTRKTGTARGRRRLRLRRSVCGRVGRRRAGRSAAQAAATAPAPIVRAAAPPPERPARWFGRTKLRIAKGTGQRLCGRKSG